MKTKTARMVSVLHQVPEYRRLRTALETQVKRLPLLVISARWTVDITLKLHVVGPIQPLPSRTGRGQAKRPDLHHGGGERAWHPAKQAVPDGVRSVRVLAADAARKVLSGDQQRPSALPGRDCRHLQPFGDRQPDPAKDDAAALLRRQQAQQPLHLEGRGAIEQPYLIDVDEVPTLEELAEGAGLAALPPSS